MDGAEDDEAREQGPFELENILLESVNERGTIHVLVKWKGYSFSECTWEAYNRLSKGLRDWWVTEKSMRYPGIGDASIQIKR